VRRRALVVTESKLAGVDTVTATITRATDGWFTLTVSATENGQPRVLLEGRAATIVDAERTVEKFAVRHGASCHTVKVRHR
jgi:hypothetical protein